MNSPACQGFRLKTGLPPDRAFNGGLDRFDLALTEMQVLKALSKGVLVNRVEVIDGVLNRHHDALVNPDAVRLGSESFPNLLDMSHLFGHLQRQAGLALLDGLANRLQRFDLFSG